jgi:hypothetical protein
VLDYDCQNASKLGVPMCIRLMEEIRAGEIIIVVDAAAVDGRDKSCW